MSYRNMHAIAVKYLPATDTKGSRLKATCERHTETICYPHDLNPDDARDLAATTLAHRMGWPGKLHRAYMGDLTLYLHTDATTRHVVTLTTEAA